MYIAMNRFKIILGEESKFEELWRNWETHLDSVKGFRKFNLLKGPTSKEHTLYASHSIWNSKDDFENWKAGLESDEEKDKSHMGGNFLSNLFGVKIPSLKDLFTGN